jgi:hypothetical protein
MSACQANSCQYDLGFLIGHAVSMATPSTGWSLPGSPDLPPDSHDDANASQPGPARGNGDDGSSEAYDSDSDGDEGGQAGSLMVRIRGDPVCATLRRIPMLCGLAPAFGRVEILTVATRYSACYTLGTSMSPRQGLSRTPTTATLRLQVPGSEAGADDAAIAAAMTGMGLGMAASTSNRRLRSPQGTPDMTRVWAIGCRPLLLVAEHRKLEQVAVVSWEMLPYLICRRRLQSGQLWQRNAVLQRPETEANATAINPFSASAADPFASQPLPENGPDAQAWPPPLPGVGEKPAANGDAEETASVLSEEVDEVCPPTPRPQC